MTIDDLARFYKSSYLFRKQTGMSATTYMNWVHWGFIPIKAQFEIEALTGGALKADIKHARKPIK